MLMRIVSLALLVVLVACGAASEPPAAPVAPAAVSSGLTPDMLMGRWGDNGDCTKDIIFAADGTFRSYTGGAGTWSLQGDRMIMSGPGGAFEVRVEVIDSDRLVIRNPDGSVGTSQRC